MLRFLLPSIVVSVVGVMATTPLRAFPEIQPVSCSASDLDEIVGYTALTLTNVVGEFEGADFDKLVKLDNGMIFEFREYNYSYAYRPDVIVFARKASYAGKDLVLYLLLIEDELYDVTRVR